MVAVLIPDCKDDSIPLDSTSKGYKTGMKKVGKRQIIQFTVGHSFIETNTFTTLQIVQTQTLLSSGAYLAQTAPNSQQEVNAIDWGLIDWH